MKDGYTEVLSTTSEGWPVLILVSLDPGGLLLKIRPAETGVVQTLRLKPSEAYDLGMALINLSEDHA